jgi:hypothetical protein
MLYKTPASRDSDVAVKYWLLITERMQRSGGGVNRRRRGEGRVSQLVSCLSPPTEVKPFEGLHQALNY